MSTITRFTLEEANERLAAGEKVYLNYKVYSDWQAHEVLEIRGKTVFARGLRVESDPNWKPEWVPGGFSAHCTNQHEQKWLFTSNPRSPVERFSFRPKIKAFVRVGCAISAGGLRGYLEPEPCAFYDYNF